MICWVAGGVAKQAAPRKRVSAGRKRKCGTVRRRRFIFVVVVVVVVVVV
jgi:hypothetical protein